MPPSPTTPSSKYRDRQLAALLRELRADVKPLPTANRTLERVEARLVYLLRVLDGWDATHAARAETLLQAGRTEAAAAAAALVFDEAMRHSLYDRAPVGQDDEAEERIARATALGYEVLQ